MANMSIDELRKKVADLKKEREDLISELKTKHGDVYAWFVEHHLDLRDLGKFAANIAAAIAILATTAVNQIKPAVSAPKPIVVSQPKPSNSDGINSKDRAAYVWSKYGSTIRKVAERYDIDPNLIFATIMIESGGNEKAYRYEPRLRDASYGLGQVLYSTAVLLGYHGLPQGLFDPEVSIDLIGRYHRRNLDRHGGKLTPTQLTIAYNTGSPYKKPLPGHLKKFEKWYHRVANLEVTI